MKDKRIRELVALLNEYSRAYYTFDNPKVEDWEYDRLYEELKRLEVETGTILRDSPTNRIGGEILEKFEKVIHKNSLWSMDKRRNFDDLRDWDRKNKKTLSDFSEKNGEKLPPLDYVLEYKFDGLTVNLSYEDGFLVQAATRGNGITGEKITAQIKTVPNIPLSVSFKNSLEIQGEGIMPLSSLENYNRTHEEKLKNARNAAAGALRNLDPKIAKERGLRVYAYNIGYYEGLNFETHWESLNFLRENNIPTFPYAKKFSDFEELLLEIERQGEERHKLDVLTDGMCIKINSLRLREILGYTNKFPRWAMAYKYEAEEVITELSEVVWNVGRSARLTPSAILKPIYISGATVSRATLNNYDDILRKGLRLKSDIIVRRSNEVIPEVLGAIPTERETFEIEKPSVCPSCGSELVEEGANLFCPNSLGCKPQLVMRTVHFASRAAMNIEGFSEKTAQLLMEHELLSDVSDLYKLTEENLLKLPSFKKKKTENLLNAIEKSKNPSLSAFIYAVGIRNVGIATARALCEKFKSWEELSKKSAEELTEVQDIGEVMAFDIVNFFRDERVQKVISELFSLGVKIRQESYEKLPETFFTGKSVVISGTFKSMKREEMESTVRNMGGRTSSSVSKKTDFLIFGENAGSKYNKAIELGIKMIDEIEWEKIVKGENHG